MYAKLEENHGLARHAMAIYERSTKAVLPEEQFEVCRYSLFFGILYSWYLVFFILWWHLFFVCFSF